MFMELPEAAEIILPVPSYFSPAYKSSWTTKCGNSQSFPKSEFRYIVEKMRQSTIIKRELRGQWRPIQMLTATP